MVKDTIYDFFFPSFFWETDTIYDLIWPNVLSSVLSEQLPSTNWKSVMIIISVDIMWPGNITSTQSLISDPPKNYGPYENDELKWELIFALDVFK